MPPYSLLASSYSPISAEEEPQLLLVNSNSTQVTCKTLCLLLRDESAPMLEPPQKRLPTNSQLPTIYECPERQVSFEKRVSFDTSQNKTIEVLHRKDYTPSERQATWYNGYEKLKIQQEALNVIRWNKRFSWNQRSRMRGLENQTPARMHALRIVRYNYIYPVLAEQEKQKLLQICDPLRLAAAGASVSHCSQMKANEVAKQDATDAQDIYHRGNRPDLEMLFHRIQNLWDIPNEETKDDDDDDESIWGPCFLFEPSQWLHSCITQIGMVLVQDMNPKPTHRIVMHPQYTTITRY